MFTGLIQDIGKVINVRSVGNGQQLEIYSPKLVTSLNVGDSIAVDGVCLTVVSQKDGSFTVDAVAETLERTTLSNLQLTMSCNLEPALGVGDRFGGHFIQGHVDGVGRIVKFYPQTYGYWLTVEIPAALVHYVVTKGAIAIDGISLTVVTIQDNEVSSAIIPHTYNQTNLQFKKVGDMVNIEVDVLAKYVERLLAVHEPVKRELTEDWLNNLGY